MACLLTLQRPRWKLWRIAIQSHPCCQQISKRTIAMTNSTPPDDAKETAQQAFSIAQDTAQNALYTGGKYMRENRILVILGAVLLGQLWALFLPQSGARNPTPFRLSVTGWKKLWKSSLSNGPKPRNKHALSKMISSPRLRVSARSCISGLARPAPDYSPHPVPQAPYTQSQQVMFLPNAPAEVYEEWRRNAMRRRRSPRFFPLSLCSELSAQAEAWLFKRLRRLR